MSIAKITLSDVGNGRIEVDGYDLSKAVTGFALFGSCHDRPRLELDLSVIETTTLDAEHVTVAIPVETWNALVALGWTPPAGNPRPAGDGQPQAG